jgi:hypothetical protein
MTRLRSCGGNKPRNLVDGHLHAKFPDVITYMTVIVGDDTWGLFLNFCWKVHVHVRSMFLWNPKIFYCSLKPISVEPILSRAHDIWQDIDYFCSENWDKERQCEMILRGETADSRKRLFQCRMLYSVVRGRRLPAWDTPLLWRLK